MTPTGVSANGVINSSCSAQADRADKRNYVPCVWRRAIEAIRACLEVGIRRCALSR